MNTQELTSVISYRKLRSRAKYFLIFVCVFVSLVLLTSDTQDLMGVGGEGTSLERPRELDNYMESMKKKDSERKNENKRNAESKEINVDERTSDDDTALVESFQENSGTDCVDADESKMAAYFKSLKQVVPDFSSTHSISPSKTCDKESRPGPHLIIIIPCEGIDMMKRKTVRETWASITELNEKLPNGFNVDIKTGLVFVIANTSPSQSSAITEESDTYGDILVINREESPQNVVYKVLAAMKWMFTHCKGAQFMLKVDIDVYVHLPNLLPVMLEMYKKKGITGFVQSGIKVKRDGELSVERSQYMFCTYPSYTEGNSYLVAATLVPHLLTAAKYIPIFYNEDAYITGVLRSYIGGNIEANDKFASPMPNPDRTALARFFEDKRISETRCSVDIMKKLWSIYSETKQK